MISYLRGLYLGRFQPFHLGHLESVKYCLTKCQEVIIVVGSAQASHTFENPFTAGERVEMILLALKEYEIDLSRCIVIPIEDTINNNHSLWVSKVISLTPKFEAVFTNSPLSKILFEEARIKVESIPFVLRREYSGTKIRKMIVEGGKWDKFVPKSVYEYIISIKGVERLRRIIETDAIV
ncbi:MAG: nicotinamide-nucleotide adenylyltransferase [Nitrososphaeria archaeon]